MSGDDEDDGPLPLDFSGNRGPVDFNDDPAFREMFGSLLEAAEEEQRRIDDPPPAPALDPGRTSLSYDEADALVRNLVPPVWGSEAGDWDGCADAPLDDAQVRVCDRAVPLPLDPDLPVDALKDGHPGLVAFRSRGLVTFAGGDVPDSASLSAFVFEDVETAEAAMANVRDAVTAGSCADETVTDRPDLSPLPPRSTAESAAFALEWADEPYLARAVIAARTGPVVVLVTGGARDTATADVYARRMWDFASARLRKAHLLPRHLRAAD